MVSRFRGALVGAVVGDCLGAYFEGDMHVSMNSALQHFNAVKNYPRKKEGNAVIFQTYVLRDFAQVYARMYSVD